MREAPENKPASALRTIALRTIAVPTSTQHRVTCKVRVGARDIAGKENVENGNPPRLSKTPVCTDAVKARTMEASDEPFMTLAEAEAKVKLVEMKLKAGDPEQEYDALLNLKISAGKYDLKSKSEQQREWIIKLKRALTYWHDEANASLSVCAANELRIETEQAKAQLQRQIDRLQAELAVRNDSQFVPGRTLIADVVSRKGRRSVVCRRCIGRRRGCIKASRSSKVSWTK